MAGLRDVNKAKRRDAILDATVALFGQRSSDEVTTEEIAARAGVAPATVYNLIGTRDDVVRAVVARILAELADSLAELDPTDPIAAAELVVDQTVRAFVADPEAFRQIVRLAPRASSAGTDLVDPSEFQVAAMRQAQQLGILRADIDAAGLARQIYVSYTGAMSLWSTHRLDDDGFSVAARHGLFTALAAAAVDG
ncbi:MAG TPA: TetR/AcrR family transcriptional regulator, partial [Ilumatobacteraceae bacterium]|nr:TetR/AcrR family transcriptional regulator [Ilumatobacteraceae bacterium]